MEGDTDEDDEKLFMGGFIRIPTSPGKLMKKSLLMFFCFQSGLPKTVLQTHCHLMLVNGQDYLE